MLYNLQQQFKKSLLEDDKSFNDFVLNENMLTADERIDVYRNNIFVSLKSTLLGIFPVVADVVSVEYFRFISHEFIQNKPPQQGSLLYYGENFSEFLGSHSSAKNFPFLKDLANLEWMIHKSFYAKDEAALKAESFKKNISIDIENIHFKSAAHATLMTSSFAVYSLYNAVIKKGDVKEINIQEGECAIVYRDSEFDVQLRIISEMTYATLSKIFSGEKLVDIINSLTDKYGEGLAIQNDLSFCLEHGFLIENI